MRRPGEPSARLLAVLATAASFVSAASTVLSTAPPAAIGPAPQPANPAAVVAWAAARFTVLTPRLLRLELAGQGGGFDDRPSLAVISRLGGAAPPPFSVSTAGDALTITTSALTLVYAPPGGNVSHSTAAANSICALARPGMDVADGSRVPSWPNGANVTSQAQCCALCDADSDCSAWVYAVTPAEAAAASAAAASAAAASAAAAPLPSPAPAAVLRPPRSREEAARRLVAPSGGVSGVNCWLMMGVTALSPVGPSRVAGAVLPFDGANLTVTFDVAGTPTVWRPGAADAQNLGGSFHALDCYDVPANCIASYDSSMLPGVISRSGWAIVDDSSAARLTAPDPSSPSPTPFWYLNASAHTRPAADLYLFAHGHDFAAALADFALISGPPALPPSSVFGVWWSHWEAFNQTFFENDILKNYHDHGLPLNHVMLDVDWHTEHSALPPPQQNVSCYDYGGYTVNTDLWPAWPAFVSSLKDGTNPSGYAGLRLMLNLHPQGGTDACQANWPAFQRLINTTSSEIVPCTWGNQRIASASFAAFMDEDVLEPVDGWWTDFDYIGDCELGVREREGGRARGLPAQRDLPHLQHRPADPQRALLCDAPLPSARRL